MRLSDGKECLTVLDYVGQAHKNYNFEEKFRAMVGKTNHPIKEYIENGFLNLPKGCYIQLEKQAKEYILTNIKQIINNKANLINKIRTFKEDTDKDITLENFLSYYNLSLIDFYGKTGDRSFNRLCVFAGVKNDFCDPDEVAITKKLKNIFHINSRNLIEFMVKIINREISIESLNKDEKIMLNIMYYTFFNNIPIKEGFSSISEAIDRLLKNKNMMSEVISILSYNYNHLSFMDKHVDLGFACPLDLHCEYNRDQIMAGLEYYNENSKPSFREGVKYLRDKKLDVFFITLNKNEKDFSPSTLYEDYAINERLFHWQSQSTVDENSPTAKRYINHKKLGSKVVLFVRENKARNGITAPYTYLGLCEYRNHSGNKPVSFIWELEEDIPSWMINKANKSIII